MVPPLPHDVDARRARRRRRALLAVITVAAAAVIAVIAMILIPPPKKYGEFPAPCCAVPDEPRPPRPPRAARPEVAIPRELEAHPSDAAGSSLLIYTSPAAAVSCPGAKVSVHAGTTHVHLDEDRGTVKIGDAESPFQISLDYVVNGSMAVVTVDSQPWSIIKRDGISLGRNPRRNIEVDTHTQRFELLSPVASGGMVLFVRFLPKGEDEDVTAPKQKRARERLRDSGR